MFAGLRSIKKKSIERTTPGAGHLVSPWWSPLFQEGFRMVAQNHHNKKVKSKTEKERSGHKPEVDSP